MDFELEAESPGVRNRELMQQAQVLRAFYEKVRGNHALEIGRAQLARDLSASARAAAATAVLRQKARVYLRWCLRSWITVDAACAAMADDIQEAGLAIDAAIFLHMQAVGVFAEGSPSPL